MMGGFLRCLALAMFGGTSFGQANVVELVDQGPYVLDRWVPLHVSPTVRASLHQLVIRPLGSTRDVLRLRAEGGSVSETIPLWLDDPGGRYEVHANGRWVQTLEVPLTPTLRPRTLWADPSRGATLPRALWEVDSYTGLYAPGREREPAIQRVASWLAAPRRLPERLRSLHQPTGAGLVSVGTRGVWVLLALPVLAAGAWLAFPRRRGAGLLVLPLVGIAFFLLERGGDPPAWPATKRLVVWHVRDGTARATWVEEVRYGEGSVELGPDDLVRPLRAGTIERVELYGAQIEVHFRGGIVRRRQVGEVLTIARGVSAGDDATALALPFVLADGVLVERDGVVVRAVGHRSGGGAWDAGWRSWGRWPGRRAFSYLFALARAVLEEGVARPRRTFLAWTLPQFLRPPLRFAPWRTVTVDIVLWLLRIAQARAGEHAQEPTERVSVHRAAGAPADPFDGPVPGATYVVLWNLPDFPSVER